jgi:hypothetical protein
VILGFILGLIVAGFVGGWAYVGFVTRVKRERGN